MQVKGVPMEQVRSCAQVHNIRAVSAYAAPGWVGVCLRPSGSFYRRRGVNSDRRVNAVCWHGHERFLRELFARYPDAKVRTSNMAQRYHGPRNVTITRDTLTDWLEVSRVAMFGSPFYGYVSALELCTHDS